MTDPQDPLFARAAAAHAAGDLDTALQNYAAVLAASPDRLDALDALTAILEGARAKKFNPDLARLLEAALVAKGARPDALTRAATDLLALKYRMRDPQAAPSPDILAAFARDGLMLATLYTCIVCDPVFEAFMCRARRALCAPDADRKLLALALALAQQAANNDYVWPVGIDDEAAQTFLGTDGFGHARRAMFGPLAAAAGDFPETAAYAADMAERAADLASAESRIPLFYPLTPDAAATAQAQTLHPPSPRWRMLRQQTKLDIRAELAARFAWAGPFPEFAPPLRALVAGASTGYLALSAAINYQDVQIEAIDLQRPALAYGLAQAQRIGVPNIHFSQADLLDLPKTGANWGHGEAVGVLGRLRDPRTGLAALLDVLVPGSFVRLALPGTAAILEETRRAIAAHGDTADLAGLRRFRSAVLAGERGAQLQREVPTLSAFHAAGPLADLCFAPYDHRFDIAGLRALLDGMPARFLGFDFKQAAAPALYKKRFPGETTLADLGNWQKLEAGDPNLFSGYQFWLLRM